MNPRLCLSLQETDEIVMALNQHTAMDPKVIGFTGYPLQLSGRNCIQATYSRYYLDIIVINLSYRHYLGIIIVTSFAPNLATTSSSSSPSLTNGGGTSTTSIPNGDPPADGMSMLSVASSIGKSYFRSRKSLLNSQYTNSKQVGQIDMYL